MSVVAIDEANGWTAVSSRHSLRSNPKRSTTFSSNSFCRSIGNVRAAGRAIAVPREPPRRAAPAPPSAARTRRAPPPSSCPARSRRAGRRTARRSRRSTRCSAAAGRGSCASAGRKSEKSDFWRASAQSGNASEFEREISAASSPGTRRSFSHSRRVSRIRLASSES